MRAASASYYEPKHEGYVRGTLTTSTAKHRCWYASHGPLSQPGRLMLATWLYVVPPCTDAAVTVFVLPWICNAVLMLGYLCCSVCLLAQLLAVLLLFLCGHARCCVGSVLIAAMVDKGNTISGGRLVTLRAYNHFWHKMIKQHFRRVTRVVWPHL